MASSLVADYSSSSSGNGSSDESSDSENEVKPSIEPSTQKQKLPPPSFSDSNAVKNSVFVNPYVEAENTKMAVLEKHVKMVPQKTLMSKINGKKVCWMYRKGRCRFGHTCKFAHDSDLINPLGGGTAATPDVESVVICSTDDPSQQKQSESSEECVDSNQKPDRKRKKKPGLSQGLVPGKKVMKIFKKNTSSLLAP